jgi:hypothetical protein
MNNFDSACQAMATRFNNLLEDLLWSLGWRQATPRVVPIEVYADRRCQSRRAR